jgi:hypothetical protein
LKSDGEKAVIAMKGETLYEKWVRERGIDLEISPSNTSEANGGGERAGQEVIERGIRLLVAVGLPLNLWPESTQAGVFLYNMSPSESHEWKSLNEVLLTWFSSYYRHYEPYIQRLVTTDLRPNWNRIYAYGCRAYVIMKNREAELERRAFKARPRAYIGYLVRYVASNIYRIWVLELKRVIVTRNVVFDETQFYSEHLDKALGIGIENKRKEVATIEDGMEGVFRDVETLV